MSVLSRHISTHTHAKAGSIIYSNPESAVNKRQRENITSVSPRDAPSETILNSGGSAEIIFDIPHTELDYADMLWLTFNLTNTHGASTANLLDGYTLVDYYELRDRGDVVAKYYGQQMRKEILLASSSEKLSQIVPNVYIDPTTFVSTLDIAPSATKTVYVPLYTLLASANVPLWRQEHKFALHIRFKSGSDVVKVASPVTAANITMTGLALLMDGLLLAEDAKREEDIKLASFGQVVYKYLDTERDILSLGNTVSGTPVSQKYMQNGILAYAFVDLVSATGTNESQYTPLPLLKAELTQNSRVISHHLGDNGFSYELNKLLAAQHWTNPNLMGALNTFYISFTDEPVSAIGTGANHGGFKIGGQSEIFRVVPGNTGNNQLVVYGRFYSYFATDYNTGKIVIHRKGL